MLKRLFADPLILSATLIIILNASAYLFCRYFNKNKEAQRYYKHFEPIKFYVMEYCYTILLLSLSYNMRFVFMNIASTVWKWRFTRNNISM